MSSTAAVGYVRVSTSEQAMSGLGLAAQKRTIRLYCEMNGLKVSKIYEDRGITGSTMKGRDGLSEALRAVQERGGHLVVAKLDRLTRSVRDALKLMSDADSSGWSLHSVAEKLDTASAMGRFVTTIIAAIAELERGMISERTKAALKEAQAKGVHVGQRPVASHLDPDTVLDMVTMVRTGTSMRKTAQVMNNLGLKTKLGCQWSTNAVKRMIAHHEAQAV